MFSPVNVTNSHKISYDDFMKSSPIKSEDQQVPDELTEEIIRTFYFKVSDHYLFVSNYAWDSGVSKCISDVKEVDTHLTSLERHMEMIEPKNWSYHFIYQGLQRVKDELDHILSECPN